jgi:AcrR family transcriptional regulator
VRERLYQESLRLFRERGYERTTLRDIGKHATVSPALLYRYFPGKRAILLALYADLSADFHARAAAMPGDRWRERFLFALRTSLAVLGPHRSTIAALVPVLAGGGSDGVFAESTAFSRRRVQAVFEEAVTGATDAPKGDDARAVGRLLYLAHLLVLLWWALDKSAEQRATRRLLAVTTSLLPALGLALKLPRVKHLVRSADEALREGLIGESASAFSPPAGDAATRSRTSCFK